jgi:acyl-CoA synthetase (AMP-forming)/AMP-acid ligase II
MGEVPVAYVVPAPGRSLEPDAILRWARERLANYKVPRHVVALEALPTNATGKVVKNELRARAAADVKAS